MDELKDWVDIVSKLILIVGGLIAAFKAISEMRKSREEAERGREEAGRNRAENERKLTWEKVHAAKDLLDDMLTDGKAADAMRMLDWSGREYITDAGDKVKVEMADVVASLQVGPGPWSEKATLIRDSFDALFRHFERLEHFIEVELVEFAHVTHPTRYYVNCMARQAKEVFYRFMKVYDSPKALVFCERFDEWNRPVQARGNG